MTEIHRRKSFIHLGYREVNPASRIGTRGETDLRIQSADHTSPGFKLEGFIPHLPSLGSNAQLLAILEAPLPPNYCLQEESMLRFPSAQLNAQITRPHTSLASFSLTETAAPKKNSIHRMLPQIWQRREAEFSSSRSADGRLFQSQNFVLQHRMRSSFEILNPSPPMTHHTPSQIPHLSFRSAHFLHWTSRPQRTDSRSSPLSMHIRNKQVIFQVPDMMTNNSIKTLEKKKKKKSMSKKTCIVIKKKIKLSLLQQRQPSSEVIIL